MKYNKQTHLASIESNLASLFMNLGINESRIDSITIEEIAAIVEEAYPVLAGSEPNVTRAIINTRSSMLASCRENFYFYKLIKERS